LYPAYGCKFIIVNESVIATVTNGAIPRNIHK